jgi:hypothetical protein
VSRNDRAQGREKPRIPGRDDASRSPNRVNTVKGSKRERKEGGSFGHREIAKFGFLEADDTRFGGEKSRTHNITLVRVT